MRKIEEKMVHAILSRTPFYDDNTTAEVAPDFIRVLLHGNMISLIGKQREVVTLAGWNTQTTKSRVHVLLLYVLDMPARIRTHKGTCQYIDTRQPDIWHDLPNKSYLVYDKMTGELSLADTCPTV